MPYINIKIGTTLSGQQKAELFHQTTDAMNTIMGKRREVTVVQIEESTSYCWSVNGEPLHEKAPAAAYVDVKITQGTNSDEEKAQLINTLMQMLKSVRSTQQACYIVVHELAAASWGYDGKTQAARSIM